ncbi:MAG: ABC transporter permease [Acidobacteria bacterium]|nr:ABC transporter permease [Acidobacteriota bacterium]
MFLRILGESFIRNPRRKGLMALALALGMAVATATLGVALDVGDRLAREFRSLGANLLVTPQADTLPLEIGGVDYRPVSEGAYLPEADLGKLRMIFWRLNIVGFTPTLDVPVKLSHDGASGIPPAELSTSLIGTWFEHDARVSANESFTTGASFTHPWWKIEGRAFADGAEECLVGLQLAQRAGIRIGDLLTATSGDQRVQFRVTGILTSGDKEDSSVLAPLRIAQKLAGRPGMYRQLHVSALTKPEDDFARRDPKKMSPVDYDRWYCTPYISSIALQIGEALPGTQARAVRRVAEGEGRILTRVSALLWLVTLAALISAGLAVGATSATTVIERRNEVGLMKALGGGNIRVILFFVVEQIALALTGGLIGYVGGTMLGWWLGRSVFGAAPVQRWLLLPVVLGLATFVALAGSLVPLLRAARFRPAIVLRGE